MNLHKAFLAAREEQITSHGRKVSSFDRAIGNAVYRAASLAMKDVRDNDHSKRFRVVTAPTGSGKSCSAYAMIAAGFRSDPTFSAAYIVPTVALADRVGEAIAELIGKENVAVWTREGHNIDPRKKGDEIAADAERYSDKHGKLVMPRTRKADLHKARVVVACHAMWLGEMKTDGGVGGVRHYRGKRRSVIFVDEHPELVSLIGRTPSDIMRLRDRILSATDADHADPLAGQLPQHCWLPALNDIVRRADDAVLSKGSTYATWELVTPAEGDLFKSTTWVDLLRYTDKGTDGETRQVQAKDLEATCRFLTAASRGCSFMSRKEKQLLAYELHFEPGPGHVLLDATADLTGMVAIMPGMDGVDVPTLDFANLDVAHIDHPKEFQYLATLLEKHSTALPYINWIKSTVIDNTEAGDDVLVIAHKDAFSYDDDLPLTNGAPLDWSGRKVHTSYWGVGVGSNDWKDKRTVFLFSEFYVPRTKIIADVHAWRDDKPTDGELKKAATRDIGGDYLTAYDGHLLRWTKQLACRGNARNIIDGRCGPMKLVTTMSVRRLNRHFDRMFPGAPKPRRLTKVTRATGEKMSFHKKPSLSTWNSTFSKPDRYGKSMNLLNDLLSSDTRAEIMSVEVANAVGIKANQLARYLAKPSIADTAKLYGWTLIPGRGRGNPSKIVKTV